MTEPYTVRVVHDDVPPIHLPHCLGVTADPNRRCFLPKGHKGTCLPLITPWPKRGAA